MKIFEMDWDEIHAKFEVSCMQIKTYKNPSQCSTPPLYGPKMSQICGKSNVNPLFRPYGPMVSWSIGGFGPALPCAQQLEPGAHWNHNLSGPPGHSIHMNKIFSTNSGYPYIYIYTLNYYTYSVDSFLL